jgi:hypothetical protein
VRPTSLLCTQVPAFIDFLSSWQCHHSSMFDCMLQLGYDMARHSYWAPQDLQLLAAWVHDLAALGYEPPALVPRGQAEIIAAAAAASTAQVGGPARSPAAWACTTSL